MFRSGEETTFGLFGLTLRGPLGRCFHAHFLFFFFSGFLSNFFLQVGLSKMGVGVGFGVSFFTLTAQCIEGGSALPRYTFLTKHRCSLTPPDDETITMPTGRRSDGRLFSRLPFFTSSLHGFWLSVLVVYGY